MSEDIVGKAIEAAKHAEAIMRRTATGGEDITLTPDEPHGDWQPKYKNDGRPTIQQWHPPFGETHVKYHVYALGGGKNPIIWGSNHHGTYQGMRTVDAPTGAYGSITFPDYEHSDDPEHLGRFKTYDQAKAAAEDHYRQNYGTPPSHDYDLDSIMGEHGNDPKPGRRGLGDDEDYSRIFDAVRRALKKAGIALRRTAAGGYNWQYDPEGESHSGDGHAESYRADINDDHHMTVFRKNPPEEFAEDDDSPQAQLMRLYPHPVNMDTPWSYHLHGVGYNDNPYLKFHTPYDDNPHHTGFPDKQTAMNAAQAAYEGLTGTGHGPDPDDKQDPFDPRLLGASRKTAGGWNPDGDEFDSHDPRIYHEPDCPGPPSCDGCGYINADGEWMEGPTPPEEKRHQLNRSQGLPDDPDPEFGDPDENPSPFDPRTFGAGLHRRLTASAAPVDPGVLGRIAAELSAPCPDCGQVAGWDEHMVSPRVKVCRNCEYPMTDIGHDDLLAETLGGFDRDVAALPETDHPTLGKHGQLDHDEVMKHIDRVLAEGEPDKDYDYSTDYHVNDPERNNYSDWEPLPMPDCHPPSWINGDNECEHPEHDYSCAYCGKGFEQHLDGRKCADASGRSFEPGEPTDATKFTH